MAERAISLDGIENTRLEKHLISRSASIVYVSAVTVIEER